MQYKLCPKCGEDNNVLEHKCRQCGTLLTVDTVINVVKNEAETLHPQVPNEKTFKEKITLSLGVGFVLGLAPILLLGGLGIWLISKWYVEQSTIVTTTPTHAESAIDVQLQEKKPETTGGLQGEKTPETSTVPSTPPTPPEQTIDTIKWLPDGARIRMGGGDISQIAFSPDGRYIVAQGPLGMHFYNLDAPEQFDFWGAPDYSSGEWVPSIMAFSSDGRGLLGIWENFVVVWNIDTQQQDWPKRGHNAIRWAGFPDINDPVRGADMSADGDLIAIRTEEGEVEVLETSTGTSRAYIWDDQVLPCYSCSFQCDPYEVYFGSFAFSPNGELILDSRACSRELSSVSEIYVWNVFRESLEFKVGGEFALFSPHGQFIFAFEYEGVNIWDASTGELVDSWLYPFDESYSPGVAAFSPDGNQLYLGFYDGTLAILDVPSRTLLKKITASGGIRDIALSPDGQQVAYLTAKGDIVVNDAALEQQGKVIATHTVRNWGYDGLSKIMFTEDDNLVLWAETSGVRAWDTSTGALRYRIMAEGDFVSTVGWSQHWIAIPTESGKIQVWSTETGEMLTSLGVQNPSLSSGEIYAPYFFDDLGFSPSGSLLMADSGDTVHIWDMQSSSLLNVINTSEHLSSDILPTYVNVFGAAISPDDRLLATLIDKSGEYMALVWELPHAREPLQVIRLDQEISGWAAFVGDAPQLIVEHYGPEPSLTVWNVQTGERVTSLAADYKPLALSESGKLLAVPVSNMLLLWDTMTWEKEQELNTGPLGDYSSEISAVTFSLDNRWVAAGTYGGDILIWSVESGKQVVRLKGHTDAVLSLNFSSKNSLLASASDEGSMLIWDLGKILP